MGNPKTTIELNGKQYDARTGKIISNKAVATVAKPTPATPNSNQVVDGFLRRPKPIASPQISPSGKTAVASINHTKRPVDKSKTLMRPAVKKPLIIKNDIQKQKFVANPSSAEMQRISRAQNTQKSPHISRFGRVSLSSSIKKTVANLPVVSAPITMAGASKAVTNELEKFEQALKNANSHMQQLEKDVIKKVPFLKRVGFKNKFANVSAMSLAALLLIGFFGYQNAASISMKVASQRAGISAKMPGYVPAGYGPNKSADSSDGRVSISFRSHTDNKVYTLTQQTSSWNSSALLANHVQKRSCTTCYQTWQNEGKTVYIYDNSNATWVDGGVWYQIEGNASLTSDQLLRLANSL